jgi:hypothetical protein
MRELTQGDGWLLLVPSIAECLNLPWELLPGFDGGFLVADGRVAIRRSTWEPMPAPSGGLVAPPFTDPLLCLCTAGPAGARLREGRRNHPAHRR